MLCQACRATLPEGAAFCPTCGTRVESGASSATDPTPADTTSSAAPMEDTAPTEDIPTVTAPTPTLIPPAETPTDLGEASVDATAKPARASGDTEPIAIREWYPGADVDRDPSQPATPAGQPADSPMYAIQPRTARPGRRGEDSVARDGKAALLVIGVATVFLVGLVWLLVALLSGSAKGADTAQPSIPAVTGSAAPGGTAAAGGSPAAPPDGARRCAGGTGAYDAVYVVGTTSCPFAQAVRDAYAVAYPAPVDQVTVTARSPVTNKTYAMHCTGTKLVTCTGGVEARVYLTVK